jgi:hypothetical protein
MKKQSFLSFSGLFLAFLVVFSACTKSNNSDPIVDINDVIVINEGNFSSATGSVSVYNSIKKLPTLGVFEVANGFPVAGTIQNMVAFGDSYYVVTNASDKVLRVKNTDFSLIKNFRNEGGNTNFINPYNFVGVGNKGYVANWGTYNNTTFAFENGFITILNLDNNTIISKIALSGQPQNVLVFNNNLYVSLAGTDKIAVFNTANDTKITDITVGFGADKMLLDKNNKIWVLCGGGNLVRVNPANNVVEQTFSNVPVSGYNEKMVLNDAKDKIYWLITPFGQPCKVYTMDISATNIPTNAIITRDNLYGLGIDKNNILYVGDSKGFTSNGVVYRYDAQGTFLDQFSAGIAPNGFVFR